MIVRNHPLLARLKYSVLVAVTILIYNVDMVGPGGFSEYPANVTVSAVQMNPAVFQCCHSSMDVSISWTINGSPVNLFPDFNRGSTINENGDTVHTLTIPARSEYNGTEVVCLAFFTDRSPTESTPPVTLTVLPGFDEIPSPVVTMVTLEETYTYRCNHSRTNLTNWRVNGHILDAEINITGINHTVISYPDGALVNTLTIGGPYQHNRTTIQCIAAFRDGSSPDMSPNVTLLIQGSLHQVNNLQRNASTLSWEAPFSLDLTNVDPDIVYYVEVYNITCGRRDLIVSDCNVTEPSYTSDDIAPDGYIYEYTVIPRSNVEGATNGTSLTVTEEFMMFKLSSRGHKLNMMNSIRPPLEVIVTVHLDILKFPGNHIHAESYTISLNSVDGQDEGDGAEIVPRVVIRNETAIVFQVRLLYRRLWNYTVYAHGCDEHLVMNTTHLSTHDIQQITVTSSLPGELTVTGYFIEGSTATGVLIAILTTADINFNSITREQDQLHLEGTISNVGGGDHNVSMFVMEEDGLPFSRTATIPQVVSVVDSDGKQSFLIKYDLQPTSTGVCITCTFLDISTTDCVAVVHQRISQLSFSGLMNIESSHKLNRSGDTANGCIEGVNLEQFQVGVVAGTIIEIFELQSSRCTTKCQLAISIGVVVALVLIAFAITVYVYITKRKQKNRQLPVTATDIPENQYATVQLCVRIQSDSGGGNRLEVGATITLVAQEREESTPEVDGTSTSTDPPATSGEGPNTAPPLPPPRCKGDPVYTEAVVLSGSKTTVPPPSATDMVVYDDIQGFQNKDGQQYAIISNQKKTGQFLDDPNHTVYSDIQHVLSSHQVQNMNISLQAITATKFKEDISSPTPTPFNLEHLLHKLLPLASKWQSLGEALSLDEDRLDEIFANNETDEACLQEMLEVYMARADLNHSWEEIEGALKKIHVGEESVTNQAKLTPDTSGPTPIPFTLESLLRKLLPFASKWQSLGEALSLDEDHLSKIYTNNETDKACLQEMLELYMAGSDFNHSWEEVQEALKNIGEESVINQPKVSPDGQSMSPDKSEKDVGSSEIAESPQSTVPSKDQKTSTPNQDGQASELYTPQKMSAIPKKTDNAPARTKSNLKPKVLSKNFMGNTTADDGDMYMTDANPSIRDYLGAEDKQPSVPIDSGFQSGIHEELSTNFNGTGMD